MPKFNELAKLRNWIMKQKQANPNFNVQKAIKAHQNDPRYQGFDLTKLAQLDFGPKLAQQDVSRFFTPATTPQKPTAQTPKGIGGSAPQGSWIKGVATSFWDTGNSGYGDTGAPASGSPMQFHMVASPYLPMGTRLKIQANGKTMNAFVGDMGPGAGGKLLDLSAPAAAYLYGRSVQQARTSTRDPVKYQVTGWGTGNTLYGNSSQAQKYKSQYGGLKKYGAPKGKVKWDDIPDYFYNWRG